MTTRVFIDIEDSLPSGNMPPPGTHSFPESHTFGSPSPEDHTFGWETGDQLAAVLTDKTRQVLTFPKGELKSKVDVAVTTLSSSEIKTLKALPAVRAIWEDPAIEHMLPEHSSTTDVCFGMAAIGDQSQLPDAIDCHPFWKQGARGEKVAIAICDNGVDKSQFPVIDGWAPEGAEPWGTPQSGPVFYHGSMVGNAALIAAPNAKLLDVGVLKYPNTERSAWLSTAIQGLNWIARWQEQNPDYKVVVNNSWSTYRRLPVDLEQGIGSFGTSENHPFNERIGVVSASGIPILFAAGNCGNPCPDLRCGNGDTGPGKSVWGASSLESVISVAALDLNFERLPYSSQGPGAIASLKPDFAFFSHFRGYTPVDPGTSTASPVLAGLVALLLSLNPDLSAKEVKEILKASCRQEEANWTGDFGYGVPLGGKAFSMIESSAGNIV